MLAQRLWALSSVLLSQVHCAVLSIDDFGAVEGSTAAGVSATNRDAITAALAAAGEGDVVLVPAGKEYTTLGGVECTGKAGVTLSIEGALSAEPDRRLWPVPDTPPFIRISRASRFTVTGGGSINGNGLTWWDAYIVGELRGHRPRLLIFDDSTDLVLERITMLNSPDQNINFNRCARVTVRYIDIITDRDRQRALKAEAALRRAEDGGLGWALAQPHLKNAILGAQYRDTPYPGRTALDWLLDQAVKLLPLWALEPEDLNTDGIDPNGIDFHIHDVNILNDDDSIAVKPSDGGDLIRGGPTDCTQNILVENSVFTGFGASIGSVSPHADVNCVRNVTFRNISMPGTGKGIYVKSNPGCGTGTNAHGESVEKKALIEDITYTDITISRPWWWAVWIGPQQQQEPGDKIGDGCSLQFPLPSSHCQTHGCATFKDITLRNVLIEDPMLSPGVIMGNVTNPMRNITFDNVSVVSGRGLGGFIRGHFPYGHQYLCHDADIRIIGETSPAPCGSAAGGAWTV